MKLLRKVGATSEIWQIFVRDSSSTTGAGLTGLIFNSAGLTAYFSRDTDSAPTAITLVTMTVGTFTSSGFKEISAANMPGWYAFCPPNATLASGAKSCAFHLKGATNMAPLPIEVDLDGQVDVTHWNGTAVATPATAGVPDINVKNINNVVAATPGAAGGLFIAGTNAATTVTTSFTTTFTGNLTGSVASVTADVGITQAGADKAWSTAARILTAGTNIVLAKGVGLTGLNDLSAAQVNAEADAAIADVGLTTTVTGRIDVAISTRGTGAALDAAGVRTAVGLASANLDTQLATISGHDATAANQTTINNNVVAIPAAITSDHGAGSYVRNTEPDNANVLLIKAKTDLIPASPAAVGSAMTLTSAYDFSKGTVAMVEAYAANGDAPTPVQALYAIEQYLTMFAISGVNYAVKKLDGTTNAFVVTLNDAASPTAATRS